MQRCLNTHTHTTLNTDRKKFSSGIRTRNSSKQTAADPRFRPSGHWDWQRWIYKYENDSTGNQTVSTIKRVRVSHVFFNAEFKYVIRISLSPTVLVWQNFLKRSLANLVLWSRYQYVLHTAEAFCCILNEVWAWKCNIKKTVCVWVQSQRASLGKLTHVLTISQIIQLGAQFCLNIFIYVSSPHVSCIHVPILRRKSLYLCDTGICHSGWVASDLEVGFQSNLQTRRHPSRVTNTSVA